jgi:hypothetical protein
VNLEKQQKVTHCQAFAIKKQNKLKQLKFPLTGTSAVLLFAAFPKS